jgi:osmotically-inducible protein OsmY
MLRARYAVLMAPLALLLGASPVWADGRPSDDTIKQWVSDALREDPRVESSHITISSQDGIVTLEGEVRNLAAKRYADLETKKISGVRGVINNLEVTPQRRPDGKIEDDVRASLAESPYENLHKLTVRAVDGVVTLKGQVNSWTEKQEAQLLAGEVLGVRKVVNDLSLHYATSRPDDAIQTDVMASISRDVYLDGLPVEVTVKDGKVTLTGSVGSAYERDRATDAAWVDNVQSVDNELKVAWWEDEGARKAPPKLTDRQIEEAVREELYNDLRVAKPLNITVDCAYGHVTLKGAVPTFEQRRLARQDAKNVVGVGWVTDYLMVKTEWRDDADIQHDIMARFNGDYLINGEDLKVRVKDGVATLSGNTNTYDERSHAVEVASRVPGVVKVVDDIDVNWFWRFTDAKIQQRIKDRLRQHSATRLVANDINVGVNDGVARLTGTVYTWDERKEADRIAFLTDGVRAVDDDLRVKGVDYPWEEWHYPTSSVGNYNYDEYFGPSS